MASQNDSGSSEKFQWRHPGIIFARHREDMQTIIQLIREVQHKFPGEKLNVSLIASGGCPVLNLWHPKLGFVQHLGRVEGVDINPAQIALCELRRQVLLRLPREKWIPFLQGQEGSDFDVLQVYQQEIEPHLDESVRNYWNASKDVLQFGAIRSGGLEETFRRLAINLRKSGFDPQNGPQILKRKEEYDAILMNTLNKEFLGTTLGPVINYPGLRTTFPEHFKDWIPPRLLKFGVENLDGTPIPQTYEKHFHCQDWFHDKFNGDFVPYHLLPDFELTQEMSDKTLFLCEDFLERLRKTPDGFYHFVDVGNIMDFAPEEFSKELLKQLPRVLKKEGVVLFRGLIGSHNVEELVSTVLKVDKEKNAQLLEDDSSIIYTEVVAGYNI